MIVYDLLCENAHRFEGWFASAESFAHQHEAGHLSCPMCGSSSVRKQPAQSPEAWSIVQTLVQGEATT